MALVDKLGEMRSIVKRSPVHLKGRVIFSRLELTSEFYQAGIVNTR
jgi:hypothetical protein